MNIGVAQVDITPGEPVEMCGFAARIHPSVGVLDPIFVKAIFLEDSGRKLLWINADLLAFERRFVEDFRRWAKENLGLQAHEILLAATHTHSAPATVPLSGCGNMNESYLRQLREQFQHCATLTTSKIEPCRLHIAEAELHLAVDRRKQPSAHTDPRALAIGFKRDDDSFIAVAVNYAMHPVALGSTNRRISADWCGHTAGALRESLPGNPTVLVSNGAAGNLNPPAEEVAPAQVMKYGRAVADALRDRILSSPAEQNALIKTKSITISLPLDTLSVAQIDHIANEQIAKLDRIVRWGTSLEQALRTWQQTMKEVISRGEGKAVDIELLAARVGPIDLLAVNGEMFSKFTECLRSRTHERVYVICYANSAFGYIPTREAYAEGGYEVDTAHFFYSFRPRIGGLEFLCEKASELLGRL